MVYACQILEWGYALLRYRVWGKNSEVYVSEFTQLNGKALFKARMPSLKVIKDQEPK